MGSFVARYHELTKYDPRSIEHLGPVKWDEQPEPYKEIVGKEAIDAGAHLPFLDHGAPSEWHRSELLPPGPPDIALLARLSWFSGGINAVVQGTHPPLYLRSTPSAGGLYPIELYWAVFDLPGIDPGIYHFHPAQITLVPVWRGAFRGDLEAILGGVSLEGVPAAAILTGIFGRSAWRYKERAYRRMLLDAGHYAANLAQLAEAEGIGAAPTAAFADSALSELLFLDPSEEVPLLVAPLRPPREGDPRLARSRDVSPDEARVPDGVSLQVHAHHLANLPAGAFDVVASTRVERDPAPDDILLDADLSPDLPGSLHRALVERRSARAYFRTSISFDSFCAAVRWAMEDMASPVGPGFDPASLSTYAVVHAVDGVPAGVWKVDPRGRFLSPVSRGDLRDICHHACLDQALAREAAVVFFHVAALDAQVERAGERVYRSLCMDAGHLGQRFALAAQCLGLGFSGIGGYYDEEVNRLLGIPASDAILYVTTLGHS